MVLAGASGDAWDPRAPETLLLQASGGHCFLLLAPFRGAGPDAPGRPPLVSRRESAVP